MNKPTISIIIPIYNVESYLCRCLDSIINQTFTDWEALLINDGSTDASGSICNRYANYDKRFKVFHTQNGGVSRARNLGLDNADGEWIMFVDADDWIAKECLMICFSEVNTNKLDFVQFARFNASGETSLIECRKYDTTIKSGFQYLKDNNFNTSVWGSLIKKNQTNSCIRFDENIHQGEDFIYIVKVLSEAKRIRHISNSLYYYNITNEQSAAHNINDEERLHLCYALINLCTQFPIIKPWIDNHIANNILAIICKGDIKEKKLNDLFHIANLHNIKHWPYRQYWLIANINHRIAFALFFTAFRIKRLFGKLSLLHK